MPVLEQNPLTSEKLRRGGGCSSPAAFLATVSSRSPPVAIRIHGFADERPVAVGSLRAEGHAKFARSDQSG
jgi:hypothetical protein